MALLPRRRDDLDPARGVLFAPLLILVLALLVWAVVWPIAVLSLWGAWRLWGVL